MKHDCTRLTVLAQAPGPAGRTSVHTDTTWGFSGADDEIRTRDPHLGKVMLYQLSYVRIERS